MGNVLRDAAEAEDMVATAASHREEVRVRSRLDERVSRAPGLAPHDSNLRAETRLELPADAERTLRRRRPIDANDDRSGSPLSGGGSPRDQDRATGTVQDSRRDAAEHGPGRASQAVRPHCHQLRALGGRRVQKTCGRLASGLVGLHVDGACRLCSSPLESIRRRLVELLDLVQRPTGRVHRGRRDLEVDRLYRVHHRHQQQPAARLEQKVGLADSLEALRRPIDAADDALEHTPSHSPSLVLARSAQACRHGLLAGRTRCGREVAVGESTAMLHGCEQSTRDERSSSS
jgi:hypothetical protein